MMKKINEILERLWWVIFFCFFVEVYLLVVTWDRIRQPFLAKQKRRFTSFKNDITELQEEFLKHWYGKE